MFDAKQFLKDAFTTPQVTATHLITYGYDVKQATVDKWFQRGSVPGQWLPVLIAIKEIETGRAVRVAQYLRGGSRA